MTPDDTKAFLLRRARAEAAGFSLEIDEANSEATRPWGGFLRIAEDSYERFVEAYWQGETTPVRSGDLRLGPKILLVAPHARLSLQYHHRRSEHWRCIEGPVRVVHGTGPDDLKETDLQAGDVIRLPQGQWHRLVGLETYGRIAEIWEHINPNHPSDEEDIVRVQDDFGR